MNFDKNFYIDDINEKIGYINKFCCQHAFNCEICILKEVLERIILNLVREFSDGDINVLIKIDTVLTSEIKDIIPLGGE